MIVHSVIASNFGSYEYVTFQPDDKGLCLISGPTGCGKSTIPDIVAWGLYGTTAKNGNVDDVLSWSNPEEGTLVDIVVTTKDGVTLSITRTRGGNLGNDLYWMEEGQDDKQFRGTNLRETQDLLTERLGSDARRYYSSAYFNESSPNGGFFVSDAKTRRLVLDNVVDLTSATRLANNTSAVKKQVNGEVKPLQAQIDRLVGGIDTNEASVVRLTAMVKDWDANQKKTVEAESLKSTKFEELKASKIEALTTKFNAFESKGMSDLIDLRDKLKKVEAKLVKAKEKHIECESCGTVRGAEEVATLKGTKKHLESLIEANMAQINPFGDAIEYAKREVNTSRVAELLCQKNPHIPFLRDTQFKLEKQEKELDALVTKLKEYKTKLSCLDQLADLTDQLRCRMLTDAVASLEEKTNQKLEKYFDSEFRVNFTAESGDSIEVDITKGGYPCVYRQLSKGQKQLLKLCFSTAVMEAAANASGDHYEQLFFDEALDGLDETLKIKAFALFEDLTKNRSSVFVIEHSSSFQELFDNRWTVSMKGETSELDC